MAERKARIVEEGFWLFSKRGIDLVTMRDIAERAGVGEKTVYRYFGSKTELLLSIISILWKRIAEEMIAMLDDSYGQKNGFQQLEILIGMFPCLYERHADYILFSCDYKLFLIRNAVAMKNDRYNDAITPVRQLYLDALEKGKEDGSLLFSDTPEEIFVAIWGIMRGYVVNIAIYDRMYEGENLWLEQLGRIYAFILDSLKNNTLQEAGTKNTGG